MPSWTDRRGCDRPTGNRLLDRLPEAEFARLSPALEPISLGPRQPLTQADGRVDHVVFPSTAVASVLMIMEDGKEVESASVGAEGMVGLSVPLGLDRALHRTICHVPGGAWRLPARALLEALREGRSLDAALRRYIAYRLREAAQLVACSALHPLPRRLSRWLLTSQDRAGRDRLPMTHELMAELLGVQRQTVTVATGGLQSAGLISLRRGSIRVLDRRGLEGSACECYAAMSDFLDRVLPGARGWAGAGVEAGVSVGPACWPAAELGR